MVCNSWFSFEILPPVWRFAISCSFLSKLFRYFLLFPRYPLIFSHKWWPFALRSPCSWRHLARSFVHSLQGSFQVQRDHFRILAALYEVWWLPALACYDFNSRRYRDLFGCREKVCFKVGRCCICFTISCFENGVLCELGPQQVCQVLRLALSISRLSDVDQRAENMFLNISVKQNSSFPFIDAKAYFQLKVSLPQIKFVGRCWCWQERLYSGPPLINFLIFIVYDALCL